MDMKTERPKEVMLIISMGFLFLFFIFHLKWLLIVAFVVGMSGALSSWISSKVSHAWYLLARGLGYVMNALLLGIVFYLVLVPSAFLYKLMRKRFSMLNEPMASTFIDVTGTGFSKESFKNTW